MVTLTRKTTAHVLSLNLYTISIYVPRLLRPGVYDVHIIDKASHALNNMSYYRAMPL